MKPESHTKSAPKLNIIVTPDGLERVTILGGVDLTLKAMKLYRHIAPFVLEIDRKIKTLRRKNADEPDQKQTW